MLRDGSSGARGASNADAPDALAPTASSEDRCGDGGDDPGMLGLRRLDRGELGVLGRDGLVGVLGDIERLANRLAGYRAEVLGALDALSRSGEAPDAMPHLTLRDAAGVSERDARRQNRVAAKARKQPAVLDALVGGDINPAQAEALCDARVPDAVRSELVAAAAGEDTDRTRRRVRAAETQHSAETAAERTERQRQARGAGWGRDHEGMLKLWARFDPETGARVEAALETLRRKYWNNDKQQGANRRTPAQRDADALAYALAGVTPTDADAQAVAELIAQANPNAAHQPGHTGSGAARPGSTQPKHTELGLSLPGHADAGAAAPHPAGSGEPWDQMRWLPPAQINVLIGFDTLRGLTDEAGLTDAGTELAPETVRKLACDAEIIPIILGGPGGSADIGRARRTVPLRLRRLLIARDRHCQWPGCHAPPSRCDAHHIIHWAAGGPTNLDNLVLLCHTHHHHLHEHGYKLVPGPDETWTPTQQQAPPKPASPRPTAQQPRAP